MQTYATAVPKEMVLRLMTVGGAVSSLAASRKRPRCLFWHQACKLALGIPHPAQRSLVHAHPTFDPCCRPAVAIGAGLSANPAHAETVVRYGISMADIPLTTGQPDRGAGAYQFTAYTIYDPLVAWEMDVADRPGKLVPGLATEWKVDDKDKTKWRFSLRKGVKFHDGSEFNADAVIWNLDKVLERQGTAIRQAPERAGQDPPALGRELRQDRRLHRRDHHQDGRLLLPLPDALVPGLEPGAI